MLYVIINYYALICGMRKTELVIRYRGSLFNWALCSSSLGDVLTCTAGGQFHVPVVPRF